MAVLNLIVCLATIVTLPSCCVTADVQVSISTPLDNVVAGGILVVQCQVWNTPDNFAVYIFRVSNGVADQITNEKEIVRSSERLNMFLAKRSMASGSVTYFITVIDVSANDEGKYTCKVMDLSKLTYVAEDSINVNIYSYPANMYPICTSVPNQPIASRVHDTLTLKCTSENGVPSVQMKWINIKSSRDVSAQSITEDNLLHAEASVSIDETLQGAVFTCELSSTGFPDWKRTCMIGPIIVKSPRLEGLDGFTTSKTISKNAEEIKNKLFQSNCKECSTDDMLQFYLTIAIAFTGFLAIMFLASTIILCYKYHHISTVTRREHTRVLAPQQSIEPVYVSLQRRSVNADREYMTLEDPNNPEKKIILPKETFDDYCRTMTLKKV